MLLKVSMKTKLTDNPLLSILDYDSDKFSQKVHKYSQQTQTAFSYFSYGGKQRTEKSEEEGKSILIISRIISNNSRS